MSGDELEQSDEAELLVGQIADEFTDRLNRGEQPDVEEYAGRYPAIADVLRQVLASLHVMRQSSACDSAGSVVQTLAGVPERLGEYRVLREVGRGGMGVVYEARQEALGRHVALKVLPFAALASRSYLARFQHEARAAARLHHSNIVPIFGVGEHDGLHYYAMQFIPGRGLDEVILELRRLRGEPVDDPSDGTGAREVPAGASALPPTVGVAQSLVGGAFDSGDGGVA